MVCIFDYQTNPFKNPSLAVIKVNFPVIISIPKSTRIAPLIFWMRFIYFSLNTFKIVYAILG